MKEKLIGYLKRVILDMHSAYISLLLLSALGLVSYRIPLYNIVVKRILPYLQNTLKLEIQPWLLISLVLLISCLCAAPLLIINRKNKSLKKELESVKQELESFKNKPEKTTLTFTNADSIKITPGIQIKTTIKQNGWYCVSDDLICIEHQRALKPDNYSRPYEYTCRADGCKIKIQTPLANLAIAEAKDLTESHIRNTLNVEPRKTDRIYG